MGVLQVCGWGLLRNRVCGDGMSMCGGASGCCWFVSLCVC